MYIYVYIHNDPYIFPTIHDIMISFLEYHRNAQKGFPHLGTTSGSTGSMAPHQFRLSRWRWHGWHGGHGWHRRPWGLGHRRLRRGGAGSPGGLARVEVFALGITLENLWQMGFYGRFSPNSVATLKRFLEC